jgi:hypothetical protein
MRVHYTVLAGIEVQVRQDIVVWHCSLPVDASGRTMGDDGQPLPLAQRPGHCGHPTSVSVGLKPTCAHHLAEVAVLGGTTLSALLGPLRVEPCVAGAA